jgi:glycosyltransferase involved in cell wall biosynthesis
MKIFINNYKWKIQPKNTDWQYLQNFYSLKEWDDSVEIRGNDNPWCNFKANFTYCLIVLFSKFSFSRKLQCLRRWELKAFISKKDQQWADVILTHGSIPQKCCTPIVFSSGFMTDEYVGRVDRSSEVEFKKGAFEKAAAVVFSSQDAVDRFNYISSEFQDKLLSIPFLLPYLKTGETLVGKQKTQVLFVGRDGKRKGSENLCQAIKRLDEKILQKTHFVFITEEDISFDTSVSYDLLPACSREQVNQYMLACDVFVMPTTHDSYGIVFIEAMAKKCAIIADDRQPRTDIFENEKNALLVDPTSVNEISMALETLLSDKEFRLALSKSARKKFEECFSAEVVAGQYLNLFSELMKAQFICGAR